MKEFIQFNQIKIGNCMINTLLIWYYLLVIFNMIFNIILYRILFRILFQNINMILVCYDFEKKNPINWRDAVALALRNGSPTPVWSPKGDVYLWLLHRASNLAKGTDRLRAVLSGWMESYFVSGIPRRDWSLRHWSGPLRRGWLSYGKWGSSSWICFLSCIWAECEVQILSYICTKISHVLNWDISDQLTVSGNNSPPRCPVSPKYSPNTCKLYTTLRTNSQGRQAWFLTKIVFRLRPVRKSCTHFR
jgi:hypothetical protein